MGSKTNTTKSTQTTTPPADVLKQYQALINRAQGVSQGATTAGPTALQNQAWNAFGALPGQYEGNALDAAGRAGAPIDAAGIARYENPYQQAVIDATMANLNENDAIQQGQVRGNAIAQGALGGNRVGVAQAELARNQNLARGQTLAGLNSANYSQALGAASADRDAAARAAGLYGGLEANAAGIAGNQLQAGEAQRGINQALLTQPYQQAQWLAQILGTVGPQEGNTTSGTQETPAPSLLQQIAGLGIAGLGLAGGLGWKPFASAATGAIPGLYADGGAIPARASGGGISSPRVHEMMRDALAIAESVKQSHGGGVPYQGIATRGYAEGGGAFPSWMFDDVAPPVVPGVELLERGTGRPLSSGIARPVDLAPTLAPPPKNADRVPLSQPILANVTPQTGIAANPEPLDMDAAGMSGTDRGIHPMGAPPTDMAEGTSGDGKPIMLDPVHIVGPQRSPDFDTSGTSPAVTAGIAQKAASQGAPEWSLPLIAAGLGILASRSPNLGVALGEGGLQGVSQLMNQRKMAFDQAQSQRDFDLRAKQLETSIAQHQQEYGLEKDKFAYEQTVPKQIGRDLYGAPIYGQLNKETGKWEETGSPADTSDDGQTDITPSGVIEQYGVALSPEETARFAQVPDAVKGTVAGVLAGTQFINDVPIKQGLRQKVVQYARAVDPTYDEVAAKAGQTFETSKATQQFLTNARTAMSTVDRVIENSKKVNRGNVTVLNTGLLALKAGTSDPDTLAFINDVNLLADETGKLLGSSQGSDFSIKFGQAMINPTASQKGIEAQANELKDRIGNKVLETKATSRQGRNPAVAPGTTAASPTPNAGQGLPTVKTLDEARKLPKGTHFLDANGVERVVP